MSKAGHLDQNGWGHFKTPSLTAMAMTGTVPCEESVLEPLH